MKNKKEKLQNVLCCTCDWRRGVSYIKSKEFTSLGSQFFPFGADPFSEGDWLGKLNALDMTPLD